MYRLQPRLLVLPPAVNQAPNTAPPPRHMDIQASSPTSYIYYNICIDIDMYV